MDAAGAQFLGVTGGECPREGAAVRGLCSLPCERGSSWDRDEKCARMQMPALCYLKLQLSAMLLFQFLP